MGAPFLMGVDMWFPRILAIGVLGLGDSSGSNSMIEILFSPACRRSARNMGRSETLALLKDILNSVKIVSIHIAADRNKIIRCRPKWAFYAQHFASRTVSAVIKILKLLSHNFVQYFLRFSCCSLCCCYALIRIFYPRREAYNMLHIVKIKLKFQSEDAASVCSG